MRRRLLTLGLLASVCFGGQTAAWAGQAPGAASDPDIPVSHRDRVYSAEQFSNTVSVTDPDLQWRQNGLVERGGGGDIADLEADVIDHEPRFAQPGPMSSATGPHDAMSHHSMNMK